MRRWLLAGLLIPVAVYALLGWVGVAPVPGQSRLYHVPTRSMEPNLLRGDRIVVDVRPEVYGDVRYGDVLVVRDETNDGMRYAKRLVGLPGDEIEIRASALYVNGRPAREPARPAGTWTERLGGKAWTVRGGFGDPHGNFGPLTVPEGRLFLLGDNRPLSLDSRSRGCYTTDQVVGRVRRVLFSFSDEGVRWRRIGARLSRAAR